MAADESGTEKAMAAPAAEPEKRHWFDEMDEIEWEDDGDIERLPCSLGYVITCLLLPFFNGCINGFAASSVGLYFKDMDWALWRLGLALLVGFSMRLITQRIQVRFGIWSALPMATFHLIGAILAVLFTAEEWAIFTEIVCLCAFDSSMAIEGIAYDTFKDDPEVTDMARQATSTSLGVFTVSMALACTAGGIIYDAYRWQGLSIFHCSCQGSLFLLLLISPTCRQSFMAYWFGDPDEEDVDDDDDDGISMKDLQVQPNSPNVSPTKSSAEEIKREANALEQKLPGQSDLVLEDVEDPSGVSKVSVSEEAPNRQVSFSEAPEAANRQVSFSEAPEAASRNVSFSEAPEAANRNVSFSEAPKAADAPEEDEEEEQKPEGNKVGKVSTVSEASGGSPKAGKVAKASSRVTFGAEEVQTMEQDLAVVMVKAPDIPAAEEDATSATADEGEIVIGVDYDQVDDLKKVFDQQDEDALTPTSRLNVWNKNGNKKGLILTHLSYEETADEHLVSSGEGDGSPSRHARGSHARGSHFSGRGSMASARASRMSRASGRASRASRSSRASQVSSMSRASRMSGASRVSHISRTSEAIMRVSRTARASRRRASGRRASELSINSDESGKSNMTLRSQMTSLAEAGTNFEHHFLVNNTLGPQIVTKTGQDDVEDDFGEGEPPLEDIPWAARGTIHPGSRLPLFLICLCGLVNSFCYATEFGTFAVLYREYYGISDATTAALCQTAGDFVAALSMQINTFSFPMVGERTARTAPLPRLRGLQQCTAPTADGLRQPRVRRMASEVLDPENEANEAVADLPVRTAALRRFVPRLLPPGPGPNMVDSASPNSGSSLRAASAPWWEASDTVSDGSNEWSVDEFTEYTMDSHHDEVSVSTQASTRATTGSNSRHQPGFMGGGLRGARSPHTLLRGWSNTGYRGRSVTRRESQSSGAAMRHRHPTHTPSRGPNPRRFLDTALAHQGVGHLHFRPIGRVREE